MLLETDGPIASAAAEGVPRDGVTDAQPMLQALLDQGRSIYLDPGDYLLRRGLETRDLYQKIVGPGWGSPGDGQRPIARFVVYPHDHAERGYLDNRRGIVTIDHPHCAVRELGFHFVQPAPTGTPTLSQIVKYAPAIRLRNIGARIEDVMISNAWDGVHGAVTDTADNQPGRAHLERVYVGAMNVGVRMDSALGTVQLSNCQAWPFGWVQSGYLDLWETSTAFQFGAIDNLQISDVIAFRSAVRFVAEPYPKDTSVMRGPIGSFSGITLDGSRARIEMTGGRMNGANVYKTTGVDDERPCVDVAGNAELSLSNLNILNTLERGPFVMARDNARLVLSGSIISAVANDDYVALAAEDQAELTVIGANFRCAKRDPLCTFVRQRGDALVSVIGSRGPGLVSNANGAQFADLEQPGLGHAFAGNVFPGFV